MNYRAVTSFAVITLFLLALLAMLAVNPLQSTRATDELKRQADESMALLVIGLRDALMQQDSKRATAQLNAAIKHSALHSARVISASNTLLADVRQSQILISEKDLIKLSRDLYDNGRQIGRFEADFVIDNLQFPLTIQVNLLTVNNGRGAQYQCNRKRYQKQMS